MTPDASDALETATAMRWSAPELTVALAEHAARVAAAAENDDLLQQACGWVLTGRIALGEGCPAAVRAVEAVGGPTRLADSPAGARLRLGVAAAARMVGEVTIAGELLSQILDVAAEPSQLRADALVELARCAASDPHVAPGQLAERMSAAGKACVAAGAHAELIGGAVLLGVSSEAERRRGNIRQAVVLAGAGLDRVRSADRTGRSNAPGVVAGLSLALVAALLDTGDADAATQAADEASTTRSQAGATASLGWLRLLLVRHQLVAGGGNPDTALESVGLVIRSLESHELPELEAACHTTVSELLEQRGDLSAALAATRAAHAAATQHRAATEAVRLMLAWIPRQQQSGRPPAASKPESRHRARPAERATHRVGKIAAASETVARHALGAPAATVVVVQAGFSSGAAAPETTRELLVRVGAKVCGALPTGGRMHPLGDGALAVVLTGCGQDTAARWANALRADLGKHWPALVGDLPAAEFRLAVGHRTNGQSVETLIADLRSELPRPSTEARSTEAQPTAGAESSRARSAVSAPADSASGARAPGDEPLVERRRHAEPPDDEPLAAGTPDDVAQAAGTPDDVPQAAGTPDDVAQAAGTPDREPRRHGRDAVNGVRSGRSLRDQWAAAGAFGQKAHARVQVAERLKAEPAAVTATASVAATATASTTAGATATASTTAAPATTPPATGTATTAAPVTGTATTAAPVTGPAATTVTTAIGTAAAPEHRIGELSFAELLAGALDAYREE